MQFPILFQNYDKCKNTCFFPHIAGCWTVSRQLVLLSACAQQCKETRTQQTSWTTFPNTFDISANSFGLITVHLGEWHRVQMCTDGFNRNAWSRDSKTFGTASQMKFCMWRLCVWLRLGCGMLGFSLTGLLFWCSDLSQTSKHTRTNWETNTGQMLLRTQSSPHDSWRNSETQKQLSQDWHPVELWKNNRKSVYKLIHLCTITGIGEKT